VLDLIYHRHIVEGLVENTDEWEWKRQLRFYHEHGSFIIRQCDAQFNYSFEYQGNPAKLVHTSLTDKCFLTLTQAMENGYGGNPYGPAVSVY
jgi:dynein heavy chain 2